MTKEKIELTLQDESGQEYVAYPFVESEDVTLSNGMDIETMIAQDVSMPIVTHEETSFKVGVGDSDISNSIVDSSVANMTIKGQTYQNILPDPTLRNSMTDGKTMQKLNEGYESVNTVDGVCKSAILSGQTLVNIRTNRTYGNILNASWIFQLPLENKNIIKPSTKYFALIFNDTSEEKRVSLRLDPFVNDAPITIQPNSKGYIISETKSTITSIGILLNRANHTLNNDMRLVLLEYQEGMENWDIPYFEGMQSVEMPVLTTTGKNLFDINGVEYNKYYIPEHILDVNNEGLFSQATGLRCLTLQLPQNSKFSISIGHSTGNLRVFASNEKPNTKTKGRKIFGQLGATVATFDTENYKYFTIVYYSYNADNKSGKTEEETIATIQIEESSDATAYESHKSNILSTPEEVVLRSLPNGVCDTLNLQTGEYVQRIGEIVLDGSERWAINAGSNNELSIFHYNQLNGANDGSFTNLMCDKLTVINKNYPYGIRKYGNGKELVVTMPSPIASNVADFKQWLSQNPITVQYQLAESTIKTVDLSSSGNWEKVVLDGSDDEKWVDGADDTGYTQTKEFYCNNIFDSIDEKKVISEFVSEFANKDYEHVYRSFARFVLFINRAKLPSNNVSGLRQYLSKNPITVWYKTSSQKSNSIKEMLSFSNGHIQLSSGADNSLIPSVKYEVPTTNSYHLDLAKNNTKYTMKNTQGAFTIDGTQYNASANGTFTTPSSITDKLMVTSVAQNEAMIIEGDVTGKDMSYFKGIKSTFEGEDKIEVLSTGKNLFDISRMNEKAHATLTGVKNIIDLANNTITTTNNNNHTSGYGYIITNLKPNTPYLVTVTNDIASTGVANFNIGKRDGTSWHEQRIDRIPIGATKSRIVYADNGKLNLSVNVMTSGANGQYSVTLKNIQIEEAISANAKSTTYEPYKSNITKIPLLSPLRSLPNGVKDEVIVNRENHKAKIIQRVGKVDFSISNLPTRIVEQTNGVMAQYNFINKSSNTGKDTLVTDRFYFGGWSNENPPYTLYVGLNKDTYFVLPKYLGLTTVEKVHQWFIDNNVSFYYELETPVITEVDLEGFPHIYKDGHIFLNGEIAPVTEIKYSINQSHMIEASNQDLIRQEKKLTNLQKLIGEYVRVDYNSTLLSLELELK